VANPRQGAGIRTFLIADVRGYTAFTQARGDEAAARLASKFAAIAREGVEAHGGEVIELRGDEALAVFTSAREAVRSAVELQQVYADELLLDPTLPLRVGIGVDAGEAVPVDGGYRGGALNLAARLCSQARAGEVLVSQGVTHLARRLEGISLHDRGTVELKGLSEPVRVLLAAPEGIDPDLLTKRLEVNGRERVSRSELPPTLDPITPIIGREAEIRRLRWAWRSARRGNAQPHVIVGLSGIGKTRLSAEVAATAADNGATVLYASLAGLSEPLTDVLSDHGETPSLVVLDDLESASDGDRAAALEAAARSQGTNRLVVCIFDDERASPDLAAGARRVASEDRIVRPQPLGADEIRRIAALYLGSAVAALPPGLLESTDGVPQRVHEQVSDWAHAEATKRLGAFASEAAAGRSDLRSVEESLASSVVDLQFVQEQARLFGAGPGRAALDHAVAPYKGLASFDTSDVDWFFGRERLVAELIARLAGATFLGVVGPSGSGKSSAVRAGLVPALASGVLPGSESWTLAVMRPGEHPLRELDRSLYASLPKSLLGRFEGQDLPLQAIRDALEPDERIVLVVDQFEETFTSCTNEDERAGFVAALTEAARDPRRNAVIVVALRADFYGRCAADPALAELLGANHVLVGQLRPDEFRRVIEQPALSVGVRIEPVLADRLVEEVLGEPGALPLLSTALLELWERRSGRTITLAAYAVTGGVRGAVARLAENAYAGLSPEQQPLVRAILLRLAGPGEGRAVVRRRVPLPEFDAERNEDVARVLDVLTARRLVTVSDGTVEVAHEALLREWPRFQEWLEEDREGRRLHVHLTDAAREWSERERDPAELYRGARLSAALDWTTDHTLELNDLEREFVNTSRAENERELVQQRRRNRRLKALLAGTVVLLAVAIAAGAAALVARSNAQHSATVALARQLGAVAVSEPRIDRAMLLAKEGVNLHRSAETEGALLATLLRSPAATATFTLPITSRPLELALSPDGKTLAVSDNGSTIRFYDTATHRLQRAEEGLGFGIAAVYSPDGSRLIAAGGVGQPAIAVRDARTLGRIHELPWDRRWLSVPTEGGDRFLVSPDGKWLYVAYNVIRPDGSHGAAFLDRWNLVTRRLLSTTPLGIDGDAGSALVDGGRTLVVVGSTSAVLVDADTLARLRTIPLPHSVPIFQAAVSPNGRTIAIGTFLGSVSFVDTESGAVTPGSGAHTAPVQRLAFSPDGRTLVTTGDDGAAIVWNPQTASPLERLVGHGGRIAGLAISGDGKTVFTSSLDGAVFRWDLGDESRFGRSFSTGTPGETHFGRDASEVPPPLAVSPDGSLFAVRAGNSRVRLYSTANARAVKEFAVPVDGDVVGLAWSARGMLAVSGDGGTVQLWDVTRKPQLVRRLRGLGSVNGEPESVSAVAFSPDGALLAAGDVNHTPGSTPWRYGTIAVWDVNSGELQWKRTTKLGWVNAVPFSPDGKTIAAAREDGVLLLYEAKTGRVMRTLRLEGGGGLLFATAAYSSDGTLATGTWAGIVQLWDPGTGEEIGHPSLVAAAPVAGLAFDPTGKTFATAGGQDGLAKLWTTKTQQQYGATFISQLTDWGNAAYTPDGSKLIVVFRENGRVFVWPTSVEAWEGHACAVAGRNLTREEWSRFVIGRSYSKTCPDSPPG
jgi:WD40 repeat protein/class 3 adenylate cyclase